MTSVIALLGFGNIQAQTAPVYVITGPSNSQFSFTNGTLITSITFAVTPAGATNWVYTGLPLGITPNTTNPQTLAGTPLESGVFTVTVQANDGTDYSNVLTYYMTVKPQIPTLTWPLLPTSLTYGNPSYQIYAHSSASAIITYDTSEATIANVTDSVSTSSGATIHTLKINGAGTVNITARSHSTTTSDVRDTTYTFTIAPKKITAVNGVKAQTKIYDGTSVAAIEPFTASSLQFIGRVGTDALDLDTTAATAKFVEDDTITLISNVGFHKQKFTGFVLAGAAAWKYTMNVQPTSNDRVAITRRPVTIEGLRANDKTYDGNNKVTSIDTTFASMNPNIDSHADLWFNVGTGEFDSETAGDKTVTSYTGFTLTGNKSNNYTLSAQPSFDAVNNHPRILPKDIYVKNNSLLVKDKNFDGTDPATYKSTPELNGRVGLDDVFIMSATGIPTFSDIHVSDDSIPINFTQFALDGTKKDNYILQQPDTVIKANINPMPVIITG
ncbi:hypothetical protein AGMMS49965_14840 [Bacteroidia bacterium]|nr:hypothetical protein AGMMS49965_14840 [Bacteroidia bacterium]